MPKEPILKFVKKLNQPIFTTGQLVNISGKSLSAAAQALNFLQKQGLVLRVYRGVWIEVGNKNISAYTMVPFLFPQSRVYVSFISALHLYGIIEQIPQIITLASTAHTKMIKTKLGVFSVHQISPLFFAGFDWYKKDGSFLIAGPEKAFVDCLYLSARKKKQFGYFPELSFPAPFSLKKVRMWVKKIPDSKIRLYVKKKLKSISFKKEMGSNL